MKEGGPVANDEAVKVLADFERSTFSALGRSRDVYRLGSGPTVLVLAEMPGITPLVASFARRVADRGFRVVMPHLFGSDGAEPTNKAYRASLWQVCVSREFTMFATKKASPVTKWLNELAHHEHRANGGPGVGVVGMCLTGGFALAMMVDAVIVAPVLSQPSLPFGIRSSSPTKADLGLSRAGRSRSVRPRTEIHGRSSGLQSAL